MKYSRVPFILLLTVLIFSFENDLQRVVTLAFLGDVNLGRGVIPRQNTFSFLDDKLQLADLVLANLESPIGNNFSGKPGEYNLCTSRDRLPFLVEWGIDLLALENNHSMDCSTTGVVETQLALASLGLFGLRQQPVIVNRNKLEIVFFAFDDISVRVNEHEAVEGIQLARSRGALVVVSIHWGMEYQGAPTARQQQLAEQLAGAGANVIWGHHPHLLQSIHWIESPAGKTLVLYSLGNALFDQGGLFDTSRSALLMVTLNASGVIDIEVIPFINDKNYSSIIPPSSEEKQAIIRRLAVP